MTSTWCGRVGCKEPCAKVLCDFSLLVGVRAFASPLKPSQSEAPKGAFGFYVVAELTVAPYRAMDQRRDRSPRGRSGDRSGISEDWSPTPRVKLPV